VRIGVLVAFPFTVQEWQLRLRSFQVALLVMNVENERRCLPSENNGNQNVEGLHGDSWVADRVTPTPWQSA